MISYQMKSQTDCGPAALAWVLLKMGRYLSYEAAYYAVLKAWPGGWRDTGTIRDDINDQPDDHRLILEKLGLHQTMVTLTDMLEGRVPRGQVVVLVHSDSILAKHWIVFEATTPHGVIVHWGDGALRTIPIDAFKQIFTQSFPNCAYRPTEGAPELSWWQRFRRWILGLIAKYT